jgi:hypothetical protein
MTESSWLSCTDPDEMLEFLRTTGLATARKLRLFGVACCRRIQAVRRDPDLQEALDIIERLADGFANPSRLEWVWGMARKNEANATTSRRSSSNKERADVWTTVTLLLAVEEGRAAYNARVIADYLAFSRSRSADAAREAMDAEAAAQCDLLRDIFGPAAVIDPAWLTPDVTKLAEAAYDGCWGPDHFEVLSDALEAAGCTDPQVLEHARGGGGHVKGCWLVDGLLGHC